MTEPTIITPHEEKQIRCPKLGGPVHFDYCRVEQCGSPCSRALVCWSVHFDAETYFRETLSAEEFSQCFLSPQHSKVSTLVELIERARQLVKEKAPDKDPSS